MFLANQWAELDAHYRAEFDLDTDEIEVLRAMYFLGAVTTINRIAALAAADNRQGYADFVNELFLYNQPSKESMQ